MRDFVFSVEMLALSGMEQRTKQAIQCISTQRLEKE